MKRLLLHILCIFACQTLVAQSSPIVTVVENGKAQIRHKVVAKETWYSVGRNYNLKPTDIASANGLGIDKPLNIGQVLVIPMKPNNFTQTGSPASDEAFIPVQHIVQPGEALYRIGQLYEKVSPESVKKMSGLSSDAIRPGMKLVVGYLRVKKGQSSLAGSTATPLPTRTEGDIPVTRDTQPIASSPSRPNAGIPTDTLRESVQTVPAKPVTTTVPPVAAPSSEESSRLPPGPGYFEGLFVEQSGTGKSAEDKGQAATFKSTSGWNDGKYYVLMNGLEPGTVVKISEVSGGKFIYAKVLGDLPPIRENEGLKARLSNAGMSRLGLAEATHSFTFQWHQ